MTSRIVEPVILKTDGLGRVRTPVAQREALLDAFERSGLSGMKFAALHGVKYTSFAYWVPRRKRQRLQGSASPADGQAGQPDHGPAGTGESFHWLEAVVAGGTSGVCGSERSPLGLRLHLPGRRAHGNLRHRPSAGPRAQPRDFRTASRSSAEWA